MIIIIMFKQFVDRERELRWLEENYVKTGSSFLIIYGRRRVGKTELIKQFSKDKKHVYFIASEKPEYENISDLQKVMSIFLEDETFLKIRFDGWDDLFKEFTKRLTGKTVIIIDEFPYLIEVDRSILSIFQRIWDENLKNEDVMFILCGSSIGMMETHILGYKSPLYGRRTGQWKVEPFKFSVIKEFFPNSSFEDRLKFYSFLDGIPEYIKKMDSKRKPEWNLKNRVFRKGEYLYEEAENLLRQEFREPANYFSILQAIAEGNRRYGDICNRTGLGKSKVSQYLKNLMDIHVVRREYPVTQTRESRNAFYSLSDNYYDFWFEFVYPNKSLIEEDRQELLMDNIGENLWVHYSHVFEDICRDLIWHLPYNYNKVGRWWHKDVEIDVVALNEKKREILFGECKWSNNRVGRKLLYELEKKSEEVKWKIDRREERFILFSRAGFTKELEELSKERDDLELYDLNRIKSII